MIITARKQSLRRLLFYMCLSFYPQGGGIPACIVVGIPACLAGLSRPTPLGEVEGYGWGVSRPTPEASPGPYPVGSLGPQLGEGVSRSTPGDSPGPDLGGCVSQHALMQTTPPHGGLLSRVVRTLLECILVAFVTSILSN